MILPGQLRSSISVSTSSTRKLEAEIDLQYNLGYEGSGVGYDLEVDLTYKPISNLNLALEPEFSYRQDELQYVDQLSVGNDDRYIFGSIDQKTLSMSLRVDLILTPELTIQFWGQPFIASGNYYDFKHITDSRADNYHDRFHTYGADEITFDPDQEMYLVTESGTGLNYEFENPDFNVKEFLSNLVFRWEYRPGSFLYLVWSQSRSGNTSVGNFHLQDDFTGIWDIHPTDVIMLKVSYRIGR